MHDHPEPDAYRSRAPRRAVGRRAVRRGHRPHRPARRAGGPVRVHRDLHLPRTGRRDLRGLRRTGAERHAERQIPRTRRGRPDTPSRPRRAQRAARGERPGRHGHGRGCAQGDRPRGRRGLRVDELRTGRGPVRLGVLRPARPQGPARLHRHGPVGVDRDEQLR